MDNKIDILLNLGVTLLLVGFFVSLAASFFIPTKTSDTKTVDCYDKNNNKIIGVLCEEEVVINNKIALTVYLSALSVMVIGIALLIWENL